MQDYAADFCPDFVRQGRAEEPPAVHRNGHTGGIIFACPKTSRGTPFNHGFAVPPSAKFGEMGWQSAGSMDLGCVCVDSNCRQYLRTCTGTKTRHQPTAAYICTYLEDTHITSTRIVLRARDIAAFHRSISSSPEITSSHESMIHKREKPGVV